ncbi:MAG TPA: PAS domain S-box protein [Ideonella sp.]|nr:PAS domain S-box protein [Ideonella sp.]
MPRPKHDLTTEARYRLLVQAVTDYAIYMLDPDGFVVSWNPGAVRLKGYTETEILGRHFSLFYPEEDVRAGMPARTLSVAASEGRFVAEAWRVRKGGDRFWASVVVDPVLSPSGELLGFAKVTRDLTERRAAEDALRRSEEQFRLLVQGVTDYAIFMLDAQGIVTNWNAGAQRIKGYTRDEIVGSHFSRFYPPADRERGVPEAALNKASAEGRFESEGWRVRKDGTEFWAHVIIDPIVDSDGTLLGYAKVTRDITEKRAAAAELELAREALFQSQKLEIIGQLTGGIAHDFNNLLMVVLSSLALIKRRMPEDPKLQRLLDNATQGARRGVSLTKRLLAFARRQELEPSRVDVPALVQGMRDMLERTLGPTVEIAEDYEADLQAVYIDANQLELALLNLAVNARDAMPQGGRLRLSAQTAALNPHSAQQAATGWVRLSIADSGVGMNKETLEHAMEPFFTTKGVGKGTGLGLAMVYGLAMQSGGSFTLKSTEGLGTTAELWLPVAKPGADEPICPAESMGTAAEPAPGASAMTAHVLVVDDDPLVLSGTVAMLEELGHRTQQAGSGAEALEVLQRHIDFDVVVTDQMMPGMSGAELAAVIHGMRPDLPVILATGFAELTSTLRHLHDRRLAKPFSPDELAAAIDTALGAGRVDTDSPIDAAK